MVNITVLLVGGPLNDETYPTQEGNKSLRISSNEKTELTNSRKIKPAKTIEPAGEWCIYEQESEGSTRYLYKYSEQA